MTVSKRSTQPRILCIKLGIGIQDGLTLAYFCNVQDIIPPIDCKVTTAIITIPKIVWRSPD